MKKLIIVFGLLLVVFGLLAQNRVMSGNLEVDSVNTKYLEMPEEASPPTPPSNYGRYYVADDAGATTPYFIDPTGTSTSLFGAAPSYGSIDEIPYMNAGGTDFSYSSNFEYNSSYGRLSLTYPSSSRNTDITPGYGMNVTTNSTDTYVSSSYSNTALNPGYEKQIRRYGGSIGASADVPTDAILEKITYITHGGYQAGAVITQVDGAITSSNNYNVKKTWGFKQGTSWAERMVLDQSGLLVRDGLNITTLANDNAETNLLAYDTGTGLVAYRSVASIGGGSSDSSWTSITTDTITEFTTNQGVLIEGVLSEDYRVTVPSGTGRFSFGDGDTYFSESSDDQLALNVGGGNSMLMTTGSIFMFKNIYPYPTTKTLDVGSSTYYWDDVFMDRAYIDTTTNYLDIDVSNNMTFTDAVTGTKTLAELASSNSYSGALTDGTPTAAQINSATSLTPSTAGAGFSCIIKDTDGSALGYNVWSDGTNWYYVALTTAT